MAADHAKGLGMTAFSEAVVRVRDGADPGDEAAALVAAMTTEEKLGCLDGDTPCWPGLTDMMSGGYNQHPWPAAVVERLGVPGLHFVDGPRGCVVGPATTFPVSMARGASFDPDLERRIGAAIGAELRAVGATFTGAVCMNLLRHPAWGRAQETYGEDPHHVGEMAAAFTSGLQEHVMACMKHFALNSMENARFKVDVTADQRALHEVYLPHFKRVAQGGVASVMSAYNSVNGQWAGDNAVLLTDVLRREWGWDGFVITDFIAGLRDPIGSVAAGCNIEMPFAQQRAQVLADALDDGMLDIHDVDARVSEIVATFLRFAHVFADAPSQELLACVEHRALARKAAVESMVLLRNDGVLPVDPRALTKVAVVGRLADVVALGDGGSSNVRHTPDPVTVLDGLRAAFPEAEVVHCDADSLSAVEAELAIVVVGYTKHDEGEYLGEGMNDATMSLLPPIDHPDLGLSDPAPAADMRDPDQVSDRETGFGPGSAQGGDRTSLRLRPDDEALIAAACAEHPNVVVAVVAGSAVVMPWLDQPSATLMMWYAGSEAGHALGDVLTGTEPGGRLPFAVPTDESHLVDFDPDATTATYGLLHGQWWLDACGVEPHLPFGYGLSYATFDLGGARRKADAVIVDLANTSARSGSTVAQVYASVPSSEFERPAKRLIGFAKVELAAGERRSIEIALDLSQLDVRMNDEWVREELDIELFVGLDRGDLRECRRSRPDAPRN